MTTKTEVRGTTTAKTVRRPVRRTQLGRAVRTTALVLALVDTAIGVYEHFTAEDRRA